MSNNTKSFVPIDPDDREALEKAEEVELYVPEYKPEKYKKSSEVIKKISIVLFVLMLVGVVIFLLKVFIDKDAFMVSVNGVPEKDWGWITILLSMIVAGLGIPSLLLFVLHKRLKQANSVFAEKDEQKRLEKHLEFEKQAEVASDVHRVAAAKSLMDNFKK